MKSPELTNDLERLVDDFGLTDVVETLSTIATLKAVHIEERYKDHQLAEGWRRASVRLSHLALYFRRWPAFTK